MSNFNDIFNSIPCSSHVCRVGDTFCSWKKWGDNKTGLHKFPKEEFPNTPDCDPSRLGNYLQILRWQLTIACRIIMVYLWGLPHQPATIWGLPHQPATISQRSNYYKSFVGLRQLFLLSYWKSLHFEIQVGTKGKPLILIPSKVQPVTIL